MFKRESMVKSPNQPMPYNQKVSNQPNVNQQIVRKGHATLWGLHGGTTVMDYVLGTRHVWGPTKVWGGANVTREGKGQAEGNGGGGGSGGGGGGGGRWGGGELGCQWGPGNRCVGG